jgi:rare lipoprotein A
MKKLLIFGILFFFSSACGILKQPISTPVAEDTNLTYGKVLASGEASFYGGKFQGRRTASGEKFDKNKLTAAHKTLPFNTKIEVKNLKNGKTVIVKINDRMPKSNKRIIDLSEAAARQLDMIKSGVAKVELKAVR